MSPGRPTHVTEICGRGPLCRGRAHCRVRSGPCPRRGPGPDRGQRYEGPYRRARSAGACAPPSQGSPWSTSTVGFVFNVEVQVRKKEEQALTPAAAAQTAGSVGGDTGAAAVATAVAEDEEAVKADPPSAEADEAEDVFVPGFGEDRPDHLQYSAPNEDGSVERHSESTDEYAGTSRNAPCPCGSGKKFKKCHGDPAHR